MLGVAVANATLTAIKGGGFSEDYDTAEGAEATTRWTGSVGAYVVEQQRTELGQEVDVVDRTKLIVPLEQGLLAEREDDAEYTWRGTAYTRTIQHIEPAEVAGTVRFYLEDE